MTDLHAGVAPPGATRTAGVLLQRTCACGCHTFSGGECAHCRAQQLGNRGDDIILSQPGEALELEAERAADSILAGRSARMSAGLTNRLARSQRVQAVAPPAPSAHRSIGARLTQLRGRGVELQASIRGALEPRFGYDFSRVHVHADTEASQLAADVGARAFAFGTDLVFASGEFAPHTRVGARLLTHELAHVVQQDGAATSVIFRASAAACSPPARCAVPDHIGGGPEGSWKLTVAVDREQKGLGRLATGNVGHTWVKLTASNGTKYSYGFWPQTFFDRKNPLGTVAGCAHHPDTAHEPPAAVDYLDIDYPISKADATSALRHAQDVCLTRPGYNLVSYNCTSFAIDNARAAHVSPPSSTTLAIHNPNALYEGIEEGREGHPVLGALIGGGLGAIGGALIGSALGPAGAIVGGLVGAIAGGIGGLLIGE